MAVSIGVRSFWQGDQRPRLSRAMAASSGVSCGCPPRRCEPGLVEHQTQWTTGLTQEVHNSPETHPSQRVLQLPLVIRLCSIMPLGLWEIHPNPFEGDRGGMCPPFDCCFCDALRRAGALLEHHACCWLGSMRPSTLGLNRFTCLLSLGMVQSFEPGRSEMGGFIRNEDV